MANLIVTSNDNFVNIDFGIYGQNNKTSQNYLINKRLIEEVFNIRRWSCSLHER